MFDKYELEIIERALKRTVSKMRESEFISEDDPHLLKCDALLAKLAGKIESL